jgi:hypothetical protein
MSKARWSRHCSLHLLLKTVCKFLVLVLLPVWVVPQLVMAQNLTTSPPAESSSKATEATWQLHYTGSLFGYYRVEPDGKIEFTPPKKFDLEHEYKELLLGMGDNFSPEFGASVERELAETDSCYLIPPPEKKGKKEPLKVLYKDHKNIAPEILYKDSDRLPKQAECDNVARFLMEAGYRAIVPGKEDFIYSAVWLRRIALALQAASGVKADKQTSSGPAKDDKNGADSGEIKHPVNNNLHFPEEYDKSDTHPVVQHKFGDGTKLIHNADQKLLMLAANLRWNFTPHGNIQGLETPSQGSQGPSHADAPSWFPKKDFSENVQKVCPLMFTWDPPRQSSETCIPGGDQGNTVTTEMDWLRRFDTTVQPEPDCKLSKDDLEDPEKESVEHCFPVAMSINMRARTDPAFRRQLLENGAVSLAAALSDHLGKEVCPKLKLKDGTAKEDCISDLKDILQALGDHDHKAFEKLTDKRLQLSVQGREQLDKLKHFIGRMPEPSQLPNSSPVEDLHLVLKALKEKLNDSSRNDRNFLFALDVRKAAIRLLLRKIADEQENVGYTIVTSGGMPRTLVIGIIGRDTMKAVSPTNLRVCTRLKGQEGRDGSCGGRSDPRLEGTVVVGDPVLAVTTVLRAAWLKWHTPPHDEFDKVVVMAQMPRTQAEELAAHSAVSLKSTACSDNQEEPIVDQPVCPEDVAKKAPHIDLILSEALEAHTTPELALTYPADELIPVIAPKPAWFINREGKDLINPISVVTIACDKPENGITQTPNDCPMRTIHNTAPPGDNIEPEKMPTMAQLLHTELQHVALLHPSGDLANLENFWNSCHDQKACQDSAVTQYLLEQIHRSSQADVVFLQYRDFYYGPMLGGYETDYICDEWVQKNEKDLINQNESKAYCYLRLALDRILWKGDYSERVMVDGKSLEKMLTIAEQETESEQALSARDTVEEWLITFGIVTYPPKNLSAASMGPKTFFIPGVTFCTEPGPNDEASKYCVNGQRLAGDNAYYVATSDHLAQDKQVYKVLKDLDPEYHAGKHNLFITGEIADEVFRHDRDEWSEQMVAALNPDIGINKVEELQQKRPILQVDFAKWVAGFMVRSPNQSDTALGAHFSGVTDSRATTPSAQELDLEAIARMTTGKLVSRVSPRLRFGIQSDLEYDRAVTGSLTGTPPIVTYALNSFTSGGFAQFRLGPQDLTPRWFLVLAPYQYQTQITGNFLNFALTTGPGQITVAAPRSEGFSHRLGLRYELGGSQQRLANKLGGHWADSYVEAGPEYSNVNEVLSGLLLPNGSVCPASATVAFTTCVANNIVVTPGTVVIPQTETLHTGGLYWDMHLQFTPNKDKRWSLTLDTKGDDFVWPGVTLPTQSRYAFTTTETLNFKVIGNLLFAPKYSQFFYRNQGQEGQSNSLITKTFSIVAKWYFARDAAVPFWRQLFFIGPASTDQTKSAKMQ